MINNSFRKTLVGYLHPFGWLSTYYNMSTSPNSESNSPRLKNIRPSKQKFNISFKEFAKHCEHLKQDEVSEIKKQIKLIPSATPNEI